VKGGDGRGRRKEDGGRRIVLRRGIEERRSRLGLILRGWQTLVEALPVGRGFLLERIVGRSTGGTRYSRESRVTRYSRVIREGWVIHWYLWLTLGIKLYLWYLTELTDGIMDGSCQNLPDGLFVLKLDFRLCRVYVHIDVSRVDLEIYKIRNVRARRYQTIVGLSHRLMERRMLHIAAVDEEILVGALLARCLGLPDEAADGAHGRLDLHRQQVLTETLAEDIRDTLQEGSGTEVHQFGRTRMEGERQVRIDEDDTLESHEDIVQLRGIRLQELPSHRHIIEEVLDLEVAAHGTGGRFLRQHL
jgi:hypothetical protein